MILFLLIFLTPLLYSQGLSIAPGPFRYVPQQVSGPITVDGIPNEPEWEISPSISLDYEIQPGDNTAPAQKTLVKILMDEKNLYFGFYCEDKKPAEIRARLSDRDQIYRDDYIVIVLDPFGDKQKAYELLVNPLGIQADLMRVGNNEDETFDAVWYSGGTITDTGYTVEVAVPFKMLKFIEGIDKWGLMFARNYPRETRYIYSWGPVDRDDPCFLCQGGTLEGMSKVKVPLAYELLPYFLGVNNGSLNDEEDPASGYKRQSIRGNVGLGIKVQPNANLTIDAVYNPDFSQIESDAQVISVNNTFAIFYPEKRPFFLEGLDILQTNNYVFYSRMINAPLFAGKVTGKAGKFSYAFLSGYDKNTPVIIPGTDNSSFVNSGLHSLNNIARGRYDYGDEGFIGFLLSARNYEDGNNFSGGFDWKSKFWKNYYFLGDIKYSTTKEILDSSLLDETRLLGNSGKTARFDGEKYDGLAYTFRLERQSKNHYITLSFKDIQPTFQSHTGFITRTDSRFLELENGFQFYFDSSFVERVNIFINTGHDFTHSGIRKDQWVFTGVSATLPLQTNITFGFPVLNREIFRGKDIRNISKFHLNLHTTPYKFLDFYMNAVVGRMIYRNSDPELGTGHEISTGFTLRPTPAFKTSFDYARASLRNVANDELFFDGYILRNATYFLLFKEFQFRLITEYNSFGKSFSLFPLLSYKLNPFTTFYAGASSDYRDFDQSKSFRRTRDQYFVKFQYLWSNY